MGQANVGGAVDSDGDSLEPENPPRFCLFRWIAEIEAVCPAVALTLRAALSAQATSTAVERTFSQAGLSSSHRRTELKAETLCRHIFLKFAVPKSAKRVNKSMFKIVQLEGCKATLRVH